MPYTLERCEQLWDEAGRHGALLEESCIRLALLTWTVTE